MPSCIRVAETCHPGDIDVIWVARYGFPDNRGGPMHKADSIGSVERMAHFANTRGIECNC